MPRARVRALVFLFPDDLCMPLVEQIGAIRTCDAYSRLGLSVKLISIAMGRPCALEPRDVADRYGANSSFSIIRIRTPLKSRDPSVTIFRICASLGALNIALRTLVPLLLHRAAVVIHGRSPVMIMPFVLLRWLLPPKRRPQLILETHALPTRMNAWIVRAVDLVVVNSMLLKRDVERAFGCGSEKVLHAPLAPYAPIQREEKELARRALDLPLPAPIVCYAGNLRKGQGEFLLLAAACLRDLVPDVRFLIVGGNSEELSSTRRKAREVSVDDCVFLTGLVDPTSVGRYLSAADVLVHYMSSELGWFEYCTPAKGLDYQASGRPIVAVGIPLFEEVFGANGERAIRVEERTPQALARAVKAALDNRASSDAMAERAATWIRSRTWEDRNRQILAALERGQYGGGGASP